VGVGVVGLASLTGREHPHPGRQFRRDIDHLLAGEQESFSNVMADAVAALDRPGPLRPLLREDEHLGEARGVGGELPVPVNVLVGVHHLDRDGAFVWIHPDNDVFVHARSLVSRQ